MENEMEKPVEIENNIDSKMNEDIESEMEQTNESSSSSQKEGVVNNENKMREIEIEKMVLHCGGTEDKLDKSIKLLEKISVSKKIYIVQSTRRIPAFGISPGKKSGCKITIREKDKINDLLKRFFSSLDNQISKKQITENQICFGIHEYIEVPGLEYDRDIGITGFEVMIVFKRKGKSVKLRKIKRGKYPKKQQVTKEEINDFLIKHFGVEIE